MKAITRTIKQALAQAQAKASKHPSSKALLEFDKAGGASGRTHSNLFKSTIALKYYGVSETIAASWLWSKYQDRYPNLFSQVNLVINKVYTSSNSFTPTTSNNKRTIPTSSMTKRKLTDDVIHNNIKKVISYDKPIPKDRPNIHLLPEDILWSIHKSKTLICIGNSVFDFSTRTLAEHGIAVNDAQFIVANPMSKKLGTTQEGKRSARCKDNASSKPSLLVFECDIVKGFRNQAKIIFFLADIFPLIVAHSSGNKSYHAWFKAPTTQTEIIKAKELLIAVGGDPASLRECQLVRMPNAYRDNGNKQKLVFYKPHSMSGKINTDLLSKYYNEFVSQKGGSV